MTHIPATITFLTLLIITGTAGVIPVVIAESTISGMDISTNPGDDFFRYVNGEWMDQHPVPADMSYYSAVSEVSDRIDQQIRSIIERAAANTSAPPGSAEWNIGTFYNTAMDEELAEQQGMKPVMHDIEEINNATTRDDVRNVSAYLLSRGYTPFFSLSSGEDPGNTSRLIAMISQSGMSLPDRDYYFRTDAKSEEIRKKFHDHVQRMFVLMNYTPEDAEHAADTVLRIETRLANNSTSSLGYGRTTKMYAPVSVNNLSRLSPGMDWDGILNVSGRPDLKVLDVHQPYYIRDLGWIYAQEPVEDLKTFLIWKVIQFAAPYSSSEFVNEDFSFSGKVLSGLKEMEPRWKRVLDVSNYLVGSSIGREYAEQYFSKEERENVSIMVQKIRAEFRKRLANESWMDESTRRTAIEKLDRMNVQIGYPDYMNDYSDLNISKSSYIDNILNLSAYYFRSGMQMAGEPSDPDVWFVNPQTVNAYYDTPHNKIVLPAGILQPPFYDKDADNATNYGAMGSFIGHELTHGFDQEGSRYDQNISLHEWWTPEDIERFTAKVAPLIRQYDNIEVLPGLSLNGTKTLAENLADLGGLSLAYHAWADNVSSGNIYTPGVDGLTDAEKFFIGYGKVWRGTVREEELRNMVLIEEHPWNSFRVNSVPFNMDEFYKAFPSIGPENKLYRAETDRVSVW